MPLGIWKIVLLTFYRWESQFANNCPSLKILCSAFEPLVPGFKTSSLYYFHTFVIYFCILFGLFSGLSHRPTYSMPCTLPGWLQSVLVAPITSFLPMKFTYLLPHQSFLYCPNPCSYVPSGHLQMDSIQIPQTLHFQTELIVPSNQLFNRIPCLRKWQQSPPS